MTDQSSPTSGCSAVDPILPPADVVEGYRNLIKVEPQAASGRLDTVAATVESCRAARLQFVDAVADLIVALPPEGARYPAQVLTDLLSDDAMDVREKVTETVADLAAVLGPAHLSQCQPLFAATGERLCSDDHEFVREQAGAALVTLAAEHDVIGLPPMALIATFLAQTLPDRAANALESALERLTTADVPLKPAPVTS